jgi:hypothetical protein
MEVLGGGDTKPALAQTGNEEFCAYCAQCRSERLFVPLRIRHLFHLMITLLTGGLWLIVWLALSIERAIRPLRCSHCGWYKPEFRVPLQEALQLGEAALDGTRGVKAKAARQSDESDQED